MKKLITSIVLLTSLFGLAACNSDIVVKSDIGNITKDEFYDELKSENGEDILYNMILIKVLEDKYDISKEDEDAAIEELKAELGPQFQMFLYQNQIESEDSDEFRKIAHQLALQDRVKYEGLEVTDEELEETYNEMLENKQIEIEASHILFKFDEYDSEDDAKKEAEKVKKMLDEGGDFAELAKEHSDDSSAEQGGDVGYFKTGDMVPEFEDAAYSLKVGEISDLVKSDFGFHIIKLTDIKTLDDAKEIVRRTALEDKVDPEEVNNRIEQLLKDANIDVKIKDFEALNNFFQFEEPEIDVPQEDNNADNEQNDNTDQENNNNANNNNDNNSEDNDS